MTRRPLQIDADGRPRVVPLGPSAVPGWDLLYDHPQQHAQVVRRGDPPTFGLACTLHRTVKTMRTQNDERDWRLGRLGPWCPDCV